MATTLDQHVALDEALVPSAQSFKLSQAQILWGVYHRSNVDYAYLIWDDFVYQLEHKNQKKSNKMYYPRFTKVIIDYFMTRKPSIPRRNRVNWHYVRDDVLFSTIKVAYKEYDACAIGEAAPKPKASARKKKGGSASSTTPPTPISTPTPTPTVMAAPRLSAAAKGKQPARATTLTEPIDVERTEAKQLKIVLKRSRHETYISHQRGSDTDEGTGSKPGVLDVPFDDSEEELSWNSFDDEDVGEQTKGSDEREGEKTDESDDDDDDAQEEAEQVNDEGDDEEEVPKINEQEVTESDEGDDEATESDRESENEETREQKEESFDPIPRTPKESKDDDNNEEDQGLMIGEEERMQEEEEADELYRDVDINQGRGLQVSQETEDSHMILTPTQYGVDLYDWFNYQRVKTLEGNFSNLPGIVHQYMHQQMPDVVREAVQTQTDRLQDFIQRENDEFLKTIDDNMKKIIKEQALVEAYDADKTILDTYGESAILKRRREDDDQEGPSAGSDRGSKRQKEGWEHASASTPSEPTTGGAGRSTTGTQSRQLSTSESAFSEETMQTTCQMEEPSHPLFETELEYHLEEVYKATTDQLDWVNLEGASSRKYTTSVTKTKAKDYGHIKWIEELVPRAMWIQEPINYDKHALWGVSNWGRKRQQFFGFAVNWESALDVYSKRRIIAVIELKIVEWHNYKHLDWISVRRDDDKIYKFKEGNFKRLRLQDIEDILLLLVQWKLSNLTVEERFAFNVSLRMFTRSIVIQRRVEDLQLGVKSYQKRLNLTKPDTYRSDLKRREADGTLNDVRNALDDHLKGIQMQYLPTTIWRKGDKDRAVAMIQEIDKMLKTRRIMRSLERFVGGRQYEGDFRLL
nr:hypothetical protein [Tanacetum cinerariifolium]